MKITTIKKELKELVRIKTLLDESMDRKEYEKTYKEMIEVVGEIVEKLKK